MVRICRRRWIRPLFETISEVQLHALSHASDSPADDGLLALAALVHTFRRQRKAATPLSRASTALRL